MQQNSKCRDRDETINHMIRECSKLAQKDDKTRHDWVDKVVHKKLSKKLKSSRTNKWFMHKPDSVTENETHKVLWNYEIQIDHLIQVRKPDQVIKKENLPNCGLCRFGGQLS